MWVEINEAFLYKRKKIHGLKVKTSTGEIYLDQKGTSN